MGKGNFPDRDKDHGLEELSQVENNSIVCACVIATVISIGIIVLLL